MNKMLENNKEKFNFRSSDNAVILQIYPKRNSKLKKKRYLLDWQK